MFSLEVLLRFSTSFILWKNWGCLTWVSLQQLQEQCYPLLTVWAVFFVLHVSKQSYSCERLGSLMCTQMLMYAIAYEDCMVTVRKSAQTVDSRRKLPCCTRERNPPQWPTSMMLCQLSYTSTYRMHSVIHCSVFAISKIVFSHKTCWWDVVCSYDPTSCWHNWWNIIFYWNHSRGVYEREGCKKSIWTVFPLPLQIRKQAIKDLPSLCRMCPEHTTQIGEALSQLLVSDDASELSVIQSSLVSLFTINAKGQNVLQYLPCNLKLIKKRTKKVTLKQNKW